MICEETDVEVADNTGARRARCIRVLGQSKRTAAIGDVIRISVKEAQPGGLARKGTQHRAVIVRTRYPIRRRDGTVLRFDNNAVVLVDERMNPLGTRIFGPVARELRDRKCMKIISLALEVL